MLDILKIVDIAWPIFIAVIGAVIYKIVPFYQTRIIKYKYFNFECFLYLLEFELIGTIIIQGIICATGIWGFGDISTFNLTRKHYFETWFMCTLIYIGIVCLLIKKKKQKGEKKYFLNIFFAVWIHGSISIQFLCMINNVYDDKDDIKFIIWVTFLLMAQFFINLEVEQIKYVIYKVYTTENTYYTNVQPVKRGDSYYINADNAGNADNANKIVWVQIPKETIIKIEHCEEKINQEDNKMSS